MLDALITGTNLQALAKPIISHHSLPYAFYPVAKPGISFCLYETYRLNPHHVMCVTDQWALRGSLRVQPTEDMSLMVAT